MVRIAVTASEANRNFSRILREVERGATVTVTSHGREVARIVPVEPDRERLLEARKRLLEHLAAQEPRVIGPWTRDELYDD
jgi:prevent-host-death family protein